MTRGSSQPQAKSSTQQVCLSLWSVRRSGSGGRSAAAGRSFASSTDRPNTRSRTLSRDCRRPVLVGNTSSSGSVRPHPARKLVRVSRSPGSSSTCRTPASVLALPTYSRPCARSTCRHRSDSVSRCAFHRTRARRESSVAARDGGLPGLGGRARPPRPGAPRSGCTIEPHRRGLRHPHLPVPRIHVQRIPRDQLPLDAQLQNLSEAG
jgi:hypothetical protein